LVLRFRLHAGLQPADRIVLQAALPEIGRVVQIAPVEHRRRAQQLPDDALHYLAPQQRVIYFFEPALQQRSDFGQEIAA